MSYIVYILRSKRNKKRYVGQTADLENRLREHNGGESRSTKAGRPWVLEYKEEFATRSEAIRRERFLKSPAGWKELKEISLNNIRNVAQPG
jgi:putative endonuclease